MFFPNTYRLFSCRWLFEWEGRVPPSLKDMGWLYIECCPRSLSASSFFRNLWNASLVFGFTKQNLISDFCLFKTISFLCRLGKLPRYQIYYCPHLFLRDLISHRSHSRCHPTSRLLDRGTTVVKLANLCLHSESNYHHPCVSGYIRYSFDLRIYSKGNTER